MIVYRVIFETSDVLSKFKRIYNPYIEVINLLDIRYLRLFNKGKRKKFEVFNFKNQLELSNYLEKVHNIILKDFDDTLFNDIMNIQSHNKLFKFRIGD